MKRAMSERSLANLNKTSIIKEHGYIPAGQVSRTFRARVPEDRLAEVKQLSPKQLGEFIMEGLSRMDISSIE